MLRSLRSIGLFYSILHFISLVFLLSTISLIKCLKGFLICLQFGFISICYYINICFFIKWFWMGLFEVYLLKVVACWIRYAQMLFICILVKCFYFTSLSCVVAPINPCITCLKGCELVDQNMVAKFVKQPKIQPPSSKIRIIQVI